MTRRELLNRKLNNIEIKGNRALETAKLFMEHEGNISDIDLAKELKEKGIETSSSTVGRDLSINLERYYLFLNSKNDKAYLDEEQQRIIDFIKEKRKSNKYEGKIRGGVNSSTNNEIIRDENNHFKGSKKRG